jgi:hypothetical protein
MSRAAAPSRQPSSSRRGWLAHQQRAGAPLALRGSEADPTGFHLDAAHQAAQNGVYLLKRLAPLHLWGHPRSVWQGRTRGVGEGRLRRGMAGVQEWPPGLDHRRPFFDENPRQGVYLHLSIPVP